MKILIIGGSGVIGFKLVEIVKSKYNVEFTFNQNKIPKMLGHELNIMDIDKTKSLIKKINPQIVIHTSAITDVDLCETNNNLAYSINVKGVENVVNACKIIGSKIIYISSSFVFDGQKEKYYENDKTSPVTYYGWTKRESENIIQDSNLSYLILRTDQPYCWIKKWQHTNSVLRVLNHLNSEKILNEITDWYNCPTYVPDFINVTQKLIDENKEGIFHLVGSDFINRYEWSLITAEIFNLNKNMIEPINSSKLNLATKRPNVNLSNSKLVKELGIKMMGVKEGLQNMLRDRHQY